MTLATSRHCMHWCFHAVKNPGQATGRWHLRVAVHQSSATVADRWRRKFFLEGVGTLANRRCQWYSVSQITRTAFSLVTHSRCNHCGPHTRSHSILNPTFPSHATSKQGAALCFPSPPCKVTMFHNPPQNKQLSQKSHPLASTFKRVVQSRESRAGSATGALQMMWLSSDLGLGIDFFAFQDLFASADREQWPRIQLAWYIVVLSHQSTWYWQST